ncbi:MAG: rhodanese-like domain-containing protein [Thermoflexales bacterium]|nr:rhodanese-like domain-containing protein [Thermoflexales bacterium]
MIVLTARASALLVVLAFLLLAGCGAEQPASQPVSQPVVQGVDRATLPALPLEISVQEAFTLHQSGAFLLDVREPFEWDHIRIPTAVLIPLGQLPARVNEVPRDRPVLVICRSGNRSQAGRDVLLRAGFTSVTSVRGGVRQWYAAGLPTTRGN